MLSVHTARMGYHGDDWLDITRSGAGRSPTAGGHRGIGSAFAPSIRLLESFRAGVITWDAYVLRYTDEMRTSYFRRRRDWDTLLSWQRVVLLCFCTDATQCHRTVLARILAKLGADNRGEIPAAR